MLLPYGHRQLFNCSYSSRMLSLIGDDIIIIMIIMIIIIIFKKKKSYF